MKGAIALVLVGIVVRLLPGHDLVTGARGILRAAALSDLIDLPKALENLVGTNFRCPPKLINELLAEDVERNRAR